MIFFSKKDLVKEFELIGIFLKLQGKFLAEIFKRFLGWSDALKSEMAKLMYRQRGRFSQSFVNVSMALLSF